MPETYSIPQLRELGLTTRHDTGITAQPGTVLTVGRRTQRTYKPRARKCKGPGCEAVFTPLAKHGKYCSDICRKRDHRRRTRASKKAKRREADLELVFCEHCGNSFLATKGSHARYCSDSHKTMAYRCRRKATIRAIIGNMGVGEQEAADGLEMSGLAQARRYLEAQGYVYDSRTRAWVFSGITLISHSVHTL